MIDRRTKNAEIFRDTERRYTSDPILMIAVQKSTNNQVFITETENIIIPSVYKTERAQVVISEKRSLEAGEVYARQEGMRAELCFGDQSRRWCCERLLRPGRVHLQMHDSVSVPEHRCDVECVL